MAEISNLIVEEYRLLLTTSWREDILKSMRLYLSSEEKGTEQIQQRVSGLLQLLFTAENSAMVGGGQYSQKLWEPETPSV